MGQKNFLLLVLFGWALTAKAQTHQLIAKVTNKVNKGMKNNSIVIKRKHQSTTTA